MDFTPIIFNIFTTFLWFIPLFLLIAYFKSPGFKGRMGEWAVNTISQAKLDPNTYHLVKNVTLPTEEGGTTQIDHIIVSRFGIFVVETKNMQGWIFGGEHQKTWTQKIYKKTFKFQNPLRQNYKHVKVLGNCLDIESASLHSVVIFTGDCTFKTDMPANVIPPRKYLPYIHSFENMIFTESEVSKYLHIIESNRLEVSRKTDKLHVNNLKQSKEPTNQSHEHTCPRCQSLMVLREAKKGKNVGNQFWGCSRFPQCRATLPLKEPLEILS